MVPLSRPGQGRVVPRGAPGPVGAAGFRNVRNEAGKTVLRCLVNLISDLSVVPCAASVLVPSRGRIMTGAAGLLLPSGEVNFVVV